ncbi:MAG: hypothetical protein N3D16_01660 [Anaerolineales bacterium]|nr:hypothetical protein [Anaerolineales bacterium]
MTENLSPKQLSEQAEKAYREGKFSEAAQYFEAAARAYHAQGQTILAAEMWNNCGVAFVQMDKGEEAIRVIEPTLTLLQEQGDLERLGIVYGNLASAFEACGRYAEAQEAYLNSADILGKCWKGELRLYALKALSQMQLKQGKQFQALATFQSALEDASRLSLQQRLLKKLLEIPSKLLPR